MTFFTTLHYRRYAVKTMLSSGKFGFSSRRPGKIRESPTRNEVEHTILVLLFLEKKIQGAFKRALRDVVAIVACSVEKTCKIS
jgi:hypothetical protein